MDGIQCDFLGREAADYACFLRQLFYWKDMTVIAQVLRILAGELIKVLQSACLHYFDFAADCDITRGIFWVHNQQVRLRVGREISPFLPLKRGVDPGAFPVVVTSNQAGLWLFIEHHSGQDTVDIISTV